MKNRAFFPAVLCGYLAMVSGCSVCKEETDLAGNSVGCGNPPSLAELETTEVNKCGQMSCVGVITPTPYTVTVGKTITLVFRFPPEIVSPEIRLRIYGAAQIPQLQPQALDSFFLAGTDTFTLFPADLQTSMRNGEALPSENPDHFAFNIHIDLRQRIGDLVFQEAGLVAVVGLDIPNNCFIDSWRDSNSQTGALSSPNYGFRGKIQGDSQYMPWPDNASAGYVFVPGSPYAASFDLGNGTFAMDSLPSGRFELRMLTVPQERPENGKVPVYLLTADPDSVADRPFRFRELTDSAMLPAGIP